MTCRVCGVTQKTSCPVITPQVQKVRQLLRAKGLSGVRVGTVDDYQGQEARIVFVSTVLSSRDSLPKWVDAFLVWV